MLATPIRHGLRAPLRLAIVGSGPSGFYSAARVLAAFKEADAKDVQVHMYERLPVPNGLVRWGVAPDHLDVKNVENRFAEVASDPRFSFFGNVNVVSSEKKGTPVSQGYDYPLAVKLPLSFFSDHYTHLLLSYGCSQSRMLGIPGSGQGELRNVHSALDFVNWYNGHPAAHDPELLAQEPWRQIDLTDARQMSVIGAGNVALDVARIVLRASSGSLLEPSSLSSSSAKLREALQTSDVPEPVLQHLSQSRIMSVDINARRGPAQAAFTNKELREMMALPGVAFHGTDLQMINKAEDDVKREEEESRLAAEQSRDDEAAKAEAAHKAGQARVRKRLLSLLEKGSKTKIQEADKKWGLNFFRAPAAFLGGRSSSPSSSSPPIAKIQWTSTTLGPSNAAVSTTGSASAPAAVWGNEPSDRREAPNDESVATLPSGSDKPTKRVPGTSFETQTDLVVSSVGYRGEPLPNSEVQAQDREAQNAVSANSASRSNQGRFDTIPWDSVKGVVPNQAGRVKDLQTGSIISSLYVAGWLARGPVGVIASTMHDAYSVADLILEDYRAQSWTNKAIPSSSSHADIVDALRERDGNKMIAGWQEWLRLDAYEREQGSKLGKQREKVLGVKRMLNVMA